MAFKIRKRKVGDKPTGRKFKVSKRKKKVVNPKLKQRIKKGRKLFV